MYLVIWMTDSGRERVAGRIKVPVLMKNRVGRRKAPCEMHTN